MLLYFIVLSFTNIGSGRKQNTALAGAGGVRVDNNKLSIKLI